MPPHLVADIPVWMEVYGEVTVDPDDERKYKCVADCEPQPWDCDAASTEDKGSRKKKGADAASAGFIALYVVVGVAALAAIAFGGYWFMRAKGGAEPPMVEVQVLHLGRTGTCAPRAAPPPARSPR